MLHPATGEQLGEVLGALDGGGAHEHGLAGGLTLLDIARDRGELRLLGLVDPVLVVLALGRQVRRDRHDVELVGLVELRGLGLGGTRHARELVVHAEVILQRDRRERLVLVLDVDVLLGLDGLVHALVVAAPVEDAAGERVDDLHLALGDDVVLVLLEELLRFDGVVEVAHQLGVLRGVKVVNAELVLDEAHALLEHADRALAAVDLVVGALLHPRRELREHVEVLPGAVHRPGDDQRGARLVDEDGVDLVDDRVVVAALHDVAQAANHVVAQVVEAELVVRAVRDVRVVGLAALLGTHAT